MQKPVLRFSAVFILSFLFSLQSIGETTSSGKLTATIIDAENNEPVAARIHLRDSDDKYFAPDGSFLKYTFKGDGFFYVDGGFSVELPPGIYDMDIARGIEYEIAHHKITIDVGKAVTQAVRLKRWIHMKERGWYSCDAQINANPTPRRASHTVSPAEVILMAKGEDLNLANMMAFGPGDWDREFFTAKDHPVSEENYIVRWNEEFRSWLYGHMTMFGMNEWIAPANSAWPNSENPWDYPPNLDICDMVQKQGGLVSYSHPVYAFDPIYDVFDDKRVLFSALEIPVDAVLGKVDAINLLSYVSTDSLTMNLWYRLLNCGMKIAPVAGTDCYLNSSGGPVGWWSGPMGGERTYVIPDGDFTYDNWVEGLRKGRSFVTSGPMIFLTVNGRQMGDEIRIEGKSGQELHVTAEVISDAPVHSLDIVVNGRVVETVTSSEGEKQLKFEGDITLNESSWIAARCRGKEDRFVYKSLDDKDGSHFAHTNPVYCYLGDESIQSAADAQYFIEWIDRMIDELKTRDNFEDDSQKKRVFKLFREAKALYVDMLD